MRTLARALVGLLTAGAGCSAGAGTRVSCEGETGVALDAELAIFDGEGARSRLERLEKPWVCSVRWLELPAPIGSAQPPPGQSPLEIGLETTSHRALLLERPESGPEGIECRAVGVRVPVAVRLASEDGGLDERMSGELLLERHNTLVAFVLDGYEFSGTHSTAFAEGVPVASVELYLTFFPGRAPTRVDGSLVERGAREGSRPAPSATTAVFDCSLRSE